MFSDPLRLPRKYVDLIHACEGKYANWDPSIPTKLGDFGVLNESSGAFDVMGNIFEGDFAHRNADLLRALGPPAILPAEDFRVIRTTGVAQRKLATDANLSAPGAGSLSHKWDFSFGRQCGAVLIMIKPVMTKFPRDGNLKPLLRLIEEELDGKVLVTSIINCPAYGFVVNRGKNQSVTISLSLAAPPFAPVPITAGGGGEISLVNQSTSGSWKVGSTVGCTYTPLFELSILKRWWGLSGNQPTTKRNQLTVFNPKDDEEPFSPYMAPWGVLDDDGEEVTEEAF